MPNLRMGQEAVRMRLDALDGIPVGDLVVPDAPALVVRESTGAPAD
jgi:DNA-binding LacI/PurR family transcriptional regulator